jgi:hypothetical protein
MTTRKPSQSQRKQGGLEQLDLLPEAEGLKRADDLLRAMLNSPPEPFTTPTSKPKKRIRKRIK